MNFLPEEFEEILNIFKDESEEIVQRFNSNLLRFENSPQDAQVMSALFQDAHSLKGAARMIGFNSIQNIAHKIEDVLTLIKSKKVNVSQELFNTLYRSTDFLLFLISNSVKNKQDYNCPEIETYSADLISIIGNKETQQTLNETEIEFRNTDIEQFIKQATNIKALLLESLFVLDKYNNQEKSTHISIISDNIKNLCDIFYATNFSELTKNIELLSTSLIKKLESEKGLENEEISQLKNDIVEIIEKINFIFSTLSIPLIYGDFTSEVVEKTSDDQTIELSPTEDLYKKQLEEKLEYLSSNISQIKIDAIYVENSQKQVLSLLNCEIGEEITKIYKKIYDILDQIKRLRIKPENDIISILNQSVNITKNIILTNQGNEDDDLSLLFQRLSIVEQMIDMTDNSTNLASTKNIKAEPKQEFQKIQDFFKTFEIGTIKTLRVDTKKLDSLVGQTGELIINGIKAQKHLSELNKISFKLSDWHSQLKKTINYIKYFEKKNANRPELNEIIGTYNKQLIGAFSDNQIKLNDVMSDLNELYKKINEDDIKLNHIIYEIENVVKNIRVLPLGTVFHMFPRMVRDIAENSQKDVELYIKGSETSVDKKIIEEIKMPLIHILRNAIDHGIELPADRLKNNKSRIGKIQLSARCEENKIIIEIEDDGLGINIKKIREKALQKGLLTSDEINSMNDEQIMNLIFWPGFSTGDKITEISGRGIGLDIVQTKISQLNGKVKVYSALNKGAKVIIELPISMSTVKGFIIGVCNKKFAIPMSAIKTVKWINQEKIFLKDGQKAIIYDNRSIPILDLAEVLSIKRQSPIPYTNITVAIIEAENAKIAFIVDKLLGDQEILHKKLSPPIYKLKNISGVTNLADGDLCLIINPSELINSCLVNIEKLSLSPQKLLSTTQKSKNPRDYKILLVDDSKITLTLLNKIITQAGYNLVCIQDSPNALQELKKDKYDLIISDIDMPTMSGLTLIKHIKNDEMYANIPIMTISTSPISKIRNEFNELKINMHQNKLEFEKNDFLEKIAKLLKLQM